MEQPSRFADAATQTDRMARILPAGSMAVLAGVEFIDEKRHRKEVILQSCWTGRQCCDHITASFGIPRSAAARSVLWCGDKTLSARARLKTWVKDGVVSEGCYIQVKVAALGGAGVGAVKKSVVKLRPSTKETLGDVHMSMVEAGQKMQKIAQRFPSSERLYAKMHAFVKDGATQDVIRFHVEKLANDKLMELNKAMMTNGMVISKWSSWQSSCSQSKLKSLKKI